MKRQAWRGSLVGLFASLGLSVFAGASVAHAEGGPEPTFEIPTGTGEGQGAVAPQLEAFFDLQTGTGEGQGAVAPQLEAFFDFPTGTGEGQVAVAPQSETQSGVPMAQLPEKH